jgi:hypothetical protein
MEENHTNYNKDPSLNLSEIQIHVEWAYQKRIGILSAQPPI